MKNSRPRQRTLPLNEINHNFIINAKVSRRSALQLDSMIMRSFVFRLFDWTPYQQTNKRIERERENKKKTANKNSHTRTTRYNSVCVLVKMKRTRLQFFVRKMCRLFVSVMTTAAWRLSNSLCFDGTFLCFLSIYYLNGLVIWREWSTQSDMKKREEINTRTKKRIKQSRNHKYLDLRLT